MSLLVKITLSAALILSISNDIDYYAGREIDVKGIKSTKGYRFWERNMPDSYLIRELDAMIADSDRDNNYFLLPEEEGWMTGD